MNKKLNSIKKISLIIIGGLFVFGFFGLITTEMPSAIFSIFISIICFYFAFKKPNPNKKIKEKKITNLKENEIDNNWVKIIPYKLEVNEIEQKVKIGKQVYNYLDIIDCELIEDGSSVMKASLLGTAAKGAVFGLAGLASKKQKESKYCTKLELKITLNDISNPCTYIKFINGKTIKNGILYKNSFDKVQKCLSIFNIILNKNNK